MREAVWVGTSTETITFTSRKKLTDGRAFTPDSCSWRARNKVRWLSSQRKLHYGEWTGCCVRIVIILSTRRCGRKENPSKAFFGYSKHRKMVCGRTATVSARIFSNEFAFLWRRLALLWAARNV